MQCLSTEDYWRLCANVGLYEIGQALDAADQAINSDSREELVVALRALQGRVASVLARVKTEIAR